MNIIDKIVLTSWVIMILNYIFLYVLDANNSMDDMMHRHPWAVVPAIIFLISIPVSFIGGAACLIGRIWL